MEQNKQAAALDLKPLLLPILHQGLQLTVTTFFSFPPDCLSSDSLGSWLRTRLKTRSTAPEEEPEPWVDVASWAAELSGFWPTAGRVKGPRRAYNN